jgi:RHH-type proline utilization regulon transcriptional repressor/proline dehydrogenase/delta 1-pyrroline-5-carboxylate dehydrogenase
MTAASLDDLTRRYGHDLFARLEGDRALLFSPRWWDERMMEWSMDQESLKVQLFRFVDVLPTLRSDEQITGHLREYFNQAAPDLPRAAQLGLRLMPQNGLLGRALAGAARVGAERMARRFIAGADVPEALETIVALRRQRMAFTIDLLGEAVLTESESVQYQLHYLELVTGLTNEVNALPEVGLIDRDEAGPLPRVNVSLKLSSLFSQFDPIDPAGTSAAVKDRLRPILQLARRTGAFVNIDMEQFAYKDLTLQIFEDVFTEPEFVDWPDVGIAIQAYLRSCGDDLARLLGWVQRRGCPIWVRLVKGAYWDYETIRCAQEGWPAPVFTHKPDTDANYEAQTRFLMQHHRDLRPAIGSHNVRSIAHALALAEQYELPPHSYEFQLLFGMADPIKTALVQMDRRVRVYTPYGQLLPGMAYLVRRLLENTANQSFLRASFIERVSEDELLMNPSNQSAVPRPSSVVHRPLSIDGKRLSSTLDDGSRTMDVFRNEPLTDFSQAAGRLAMQEALRKVAGNLGATYPLVINGKVVSTSDTIDSVNPSRKRQVVGRVGRATLEHAERALKAATEAFPAWRDTPPEERAKCLRQAAAIMRERRFELAAWEVFECAKQWREADADVAEAIDFCDYYALEMLRLASPQRRDVPGEDNEYFYEPRGACVVIAPWNFPLAILCGMTAAALVTGNTAIMKPAEQSPVIAAKLMDIWMAAGIPNGVVQFLPGVGEEIGPVLVNHPDTAVIAFTGSMGVGLAINRQASETPPGQDHIKRVVCELGGKNAVIVDDDADLDEAVHGVVASAFGYQGQKCSACSRAIVLATNYDGFLHRLVEATKSLKVGPAEEPGNSVGPVIDDDARQRVLRYIEKGKQEGRLVHATEIGALAEEGYFVGPHVFADIAPNAALAQEEIFGPVLAVLKAKNLDEALAIANGTPFALTGGLFSRSPANIARVRREFRVGNLYINRKITGALVDRQPFGGFKLSGGGTKAGGPDYLLQFLIPRCITENTMRHGFAPGGGPEACGHQAEVKGLPRCQIKEKACPDSRPSLADGL